MKFEINVALNGRHLFATAARSLTSFDSVEKCFEIFQKKFPKSEGYELHLSYSPQVSYSADSVAELEKIVDSL